MVDDNRGPFVFGGPGVNALFCIFDYLVVFGSHLFSLIRPFNNQDDPDDPVDLAFQPSYGSIITYTWFGEGQILVGFSNGYLVVVSTADDEIGEEILSVRVNKGGLEDMAYSPALQRAATCGERTVKVIDMVARKGLRVTQSA